MSKEIIDEGAASYRSAGGKYINPYKHNTNEFDFFERGWVQALKKSSSSGSYSMNGLSDDLPTGQWEKLEADDDKRKRLRIEYLNSKGL